MSKPLNVLGKKIIDNMVIDPDTQCWNWQKSLNDKGYGYLGWEGGSQLAHRMSYQAFVGELVVGKMVCHECDNPQCVNHAVDTAKYKCK